MTVIEELVKTLIEAQIQTEKSIGNLAASVDKYVAAADVRTGRFEEAHEALTNAHLRTEEAIASFVTSSEARYKRLEENLDGLIRAITSEHKNGKAH